MDRETIPDDVKRFILLSVQSVPYLEALLLLHGESASMWNARDVAKRLYLSEKSATELLVQLHGAGVLTIEDQNPEWYRYNPESDELRHMVDKLSDAYSKNLIEVTNLIHSTTSKKALQFADAFKWRKEP